MVHIERDKIMSLGPYQSTPIFTRGMLFFDNVRDIAAVTSTCRTFRNWSNAISGFWQAMARQCGLPYVQNSDGTPRENPKYDLFVISHYMISVRKVESLFGRVVGNLMPISDFWFDMFAKGMPDPHEEGKLFRDTYLLMADPSHIQRKADKELPLELDEEGKLEQVAPDLVEEKVLTIPFSLRNICILSRYPLQGKEHIPVFTAESMFSEKNELMTSHPVHTRTLVMRKNFLPKTADLYMFEHQLRYVQEPNIGLSVASPRERALHSAISILTTGSCPDENIYIAGSGVFCIQGTTIQHLITGDFQKGKGVDIYYGHARKIQNAVVPRAVADVPNLLPLLEFSRLTIMEGKKQCIIL